MRIISKFPGGGVDVEAANAAPGDVVSGKTFFAVSNGIKTGTLAPVSTANATPADVRAGKTFFAVSNGIKTGTLAPASSANATPADVLAGKTFFAGTDAKKTGTLTGASMIKRASGTKALPLSVYSCTFTVSGLAFKPVGIVISYEGFSYGETARTSVAGALTGTSTGTFYGFKYDGGYSREAVFGSWTSNANGFSITFEIDPLATTTYASWTAVGA